MSTPQSIGFPLNLTRITTGKSQNSFWRVLETDQYKMNFQSVGNKAGNLLFSLSNVFILELSNFRTKKNTIHNVFFLRGNCQNNFYTFTMWSVCHFYQFWLSKCRMEWT